MSTFFTDIQGALRTRLTTLPDLPAVAWENVDFKGGANDLYFRVTGLPSETTQACLGDDGLDLHLGIFQVDVFVPDGKGRTNWPDAIADHFKRGTRLTQNETTVTITSASIEAALKDDHFYIVPVSIAYRAYTQARTI